MKYTFTTTMKGMIKPIDFERKQFNALMLSAGEVSTIVKNKSIEAYKEKRITKNPVSWIISSFQYQTTLVGNGVMAVISADTPYIQFLEDDHPLRNRKMWSSVNPNAPYKFMEAGFNTGVEAVSGIATRNLRIIR